MSLLAVDITQAPGTADSPPVAQLMVAISYAGMRRVHWSPLPFEAGTGLPAVLKALEQSAFQAGAFWDHELAWLRAEGMLVQEGPDRPAYSERMRRHIGQRLFDCLFPAGERSLYDYARWQSSERGEEMQLQLRFDADAEAVAALPWELLWDGGRDSGDFVVGGGGCALTRYLTFDSPPPARAVPSRLKVLLIAPRPTQLMTLGETESQAVRQALTPMVKEGRVSLDEVLPPSFAGLKAYLSDHLGEDLPHAVHFDGHGVFGRRCRQCGAVVTSRGADACPEGHPLGDAGPQGYLAFEDARHRPEYVSAIEFADQLRMAGVLGPGSRGDGGVGGICLVVLSACGSAVARGGESVFNGVAQRLMDAGVAAVVAMQFSIQAGAAAEFAQYLYGGIAEGAPLVSAVSLGRTALGREGDQWYRPVLYLRWRDNEGGRLFAPTAPPVVAVPVEEMPDTGQIPELVCDEFILQLHGDDRIMATWTHHDGTIESAAGRVRDDQRLRGDIGTYVSQLQGGQAGALRRDDIERLGQRLYDAMLPDRVGMLFERAYEEVMRGARDGGPSTWLRVIVDTDPQASVYWWPIEFLSNGGRWLAAESQMALSRRALFERVAAMQPDLLPLRVLLVVGGRIAADLLEAVANQADEQESRGPRKVDIRLLGRIEGYQAVAGIEYLDRPATYERIEEAMTGGEWQPHVVHVLGHGRADPVTRQGWVGLATGDGAVDWYSAEDLSSLLRRNGDLRLVLLQGCEDATPAMRPGFNYATENLARQDVAAVVGMQFAISHDAAVKFATGLYGALVDGQSLDRAVQLGRRRMWYDGRGANPSFGSPALFAASAEPVIRL